MVSSLFLFIILDRPPDTDIYDLNGALYVRSSGDVFNYSFIDDSYGHYVLRARVGGSTTMHGA